MLAHGGPHPIKFSLTKPGMWVQVFQTGRSHMVVLTRPAPNAPLPQLGSSMNSPRENGADVAETVSNQNGHGEGLPGTVTVQVEEAPNQQATEVSFCVWFRQGQAYGTLWEGCRVGQVGQDGDLGWKLLTAARSSDDDHAAAGCLLQMHCKFQCCPSSREGSEPLCGRMMLPLGGSMLNSLSKQSDSLQCAASPNALCHEGQQMCPACLDCPGLLSLDARRYAPSSGD